MQSKKKHKKEDKKNLFTRPIKINRIEKSIPSIKNVELFISDTKSAKSNSLKGNIDKKLAKIEKLKEQSGRLKKQIDKAKELFNKRGTKDEDALNKSVEKVVIKPYGRINQKSFSLWQKELLEPSCSTRSIF